MLDRFRDDSNAFFSGDDTHGDYLDQVNSGLLILTRAHHVNQGADIPNAQDMDAVSTVLSWMVKQDADQLTEAAYDAKAAQIAERLIEAGGLMEQERESFLAFTKESRENVPISEYEAGSDMTEHPAQG